MYRASRHDGARAADAIIVLGAAQYDGRPRPCCRIGSTTRWRSTRQGWPTTSCSPVAGRKGDRFTEATAGYNYLRDQGVPDEALMKEVDGTSTWESLRASARFLAARA